MNRERPPVSPYRLGEVTRLGDAVPQPQVPDGVSRRKVLLLGLDGLRIDKVDTPELGRLIDDGMLAVSPLYCSPGGVTGSGAGWSTVLSGVWPDRNNVRDGNLISRRMHRFPDVLARAKSAGLSTAAVTSWTPFGHHEWYGGPILSDTVDARVTYDCDGDNADDVDTALTEVVTGLLGDQNPDLVFVHFGSLDIAGHAGGAAQSRYLRTIEAVDTLVGRVLAALRARPSYADEDWLILATNDHGHQDVGHVHNGPSAAERGWFLLAVGDEFPSGERRFDVRMVDVAPTVLRHLGVPVDPAWGLDGREAQSVVSESFDELLPLLKPEFDALLIPVGTCGGVTDAVPEGWSVVDAQDAGEWSGWRFTTDPYWTAQRRAVGRETFVRARGVFAVADAALWDGPGRFDATLQSGAYGVGGSGEVTVEFVAQYRQSRHCADGRGTVTAVFDDGSVREIALFDQETVAQQQRICVEVPDGATTLTLQWRLVTEGSGWFAVDAVRVTPGRVPEIHLTVDEALPEPGTQVTVTAALAGDVQAPVAWELTSDLGWKSEPLKPGSWLLHVPESAVPGSSWISASARWADGGAVADLVVAVPHVDLDAARNWTAASRDDRPESADADGGGRSWSLDALAAAGLPVQADAVLCGGQGIRLSGRGSFLHLVAASAFYPGGGGGAVVYQDGTRQEFELYVPAWDGALEDSPHPVAVTTPYLNHPKGPVPTAAHLYRIDIPLRADAELAGVLLPDCSDRAVDYSPSPYVFDWSIV